GKRERLTGVVQDQPSAGRAGDNATETEGAAVAKNQCAVAEVNRAAAATDGADVNDAVIGRSQAAGEIDCACAAQVQLRAAASAVVQKQQRAAVVDIDDGVAGRRGVREDEFAGACAAYRERGREVC